MKKQCYWFKVLLGKWDKDVFDPEDTFIFIEAWDAGAAVRKAKAMTDEHDVITNVIYLGYPQI